VDVFGLLAGDEYQPGTRRDDDLSVRLRGGQILGIDAFERHVLATFCVMDNDRSCWRELLASYQLVHLILQQPVAKLGG
jgi:hypothetical protein